VLLQYSAAAGRIILLRSRGGDSGGGGGGAQSRNMAEKPRARIKGKVENNRRNWFLSEIRGRYIR